MRTASATAAFFLSAIAVGPASATEASPPVSRFAATWTAAPSGRFTRADRALPLRLLTTHDRPIPEGTLDAAFRSAADVATRRDIAIEEMAGAWEPARRTALEDLRAAQSRYVALVGSDSNDRDIRFVALLRQVVEGSGRSVAQAGPQNTDELLGTVYARVIREAPDRELPAIEASEKAWTTYRDAFDRFALAMDRPDAARSVHDDLTRRRAAELEADVEK